MYYEPLLFIDSFLTIVDVSDPASPFKALEIDPEGILVDVASRSEEDGSITAVTVNADFTEFIPGTPPADITVIINVTQS